MGTFYLKNFFLITIFNLVIIFQNFGETITEPMTLQSVLGSIKNDSTSILVPNSENASFYDPLNETHRQLGNDTSDAKEDRQDDDDKMDDERPLLSSYYIKGPLIIVGIITLVSLFLFFAYVYKYRSIEARWHGTA